MVVVGSKDDSVDAGSFYMFPELTIICAFTRQNQQSYLHVIATHNLKNPFLDEMATTW
jgi:hypothetical protein